ncbi:MAG: GntR family transcriptional regulator [Ancalomicrobiaceae bacterium]|nr:GntR family transcriptional regulator [Ancalomicrobiaceae bacterium]
MKRLKPPASPTTAVHGMDDDPVVQGLLVTISQKRLRPGAKLGEDRLAEAFGTTRIHIRQALAHLASRHVVTQIPNRGAFIHTPTWEEAQAIFAARRIIEAAAVEAAIDRLDDRAIEALNAHAAREAADSKNDRWSSLALTADFHVLIAELSGNPVLLEIARGLILRTSLAIATFETPGSHDCSPEAHPDIADLIIARDKVGALAALSHHLGEMEARIRPAGAVADPNDIGAILKDVGIKPMRRRQSHV